MDSHIARTAMVPSCRSSLSSDDYRAQPIGHEYSGAHADGFDYADYCDEIEWAKMVWDVVGTRLESYLFLLAARDYKEHQTRCEDRNEKPLARGKWIEAHVAGQIDRALEIAEECCGWDDQGRPIFPAE